MIDPQSTEQAISRISAWLQDLSNTLAQTNARTADSIVLIMPRDKDMIVTFPDDEDAKPEQCPALVCEINRFRWDGQNISTFKGALEATIYLVDDASSGTVARTKISRWIDTLISHCKKSSATLGSYSRVFPKSMELTMGKTKGDLNAFQISLDLTITLSL